MRELVGVDRDTETGLLAGGGAVWADAELTRMAEALAAPTGDGTGPAADALICQEWPGNLTELTAVLHHAADDCAARRTRVLDPAALPERYRTTSRAAHLSGREQAERQAIIDALDRHGRNKVHAARDLGISRTTLYARMRALGIGG